MRTTINSSIGFINSAVQNSCSTLFSMNSSLMNVSNVIKMLVYINASLNTALANYLTTQAVSISKANASITNLSCTSIASSVL